MTPTERQLLYCLIEECSEIQKAATKALRFGLDDTWAGQPDLPKWDLTPRQEIRHELNDLRGVVMLLREAEVLAPESHTNDELEKLQKVSKVRKLLDYTKTAGEFI